MNEKACMQERGFTIVELMVSMVIGLVLIGGVMQIYLFAKTNLQTQRELQTVAEDMAIVTRQLSSIIRNAGYHVDPSANDFRDVFPAASPHVFGDGLVTLTEDRIDIRYQDDGTLIDCLGGSGHGTAAAPVIVLNSYQLESGQLTCSVDGGSSLAVADNIEALVIRYGEDKDGDGMIEGYFRSNDVDAWENIQSVEFALIMSGERDARLTESSMSFDLLGIEWNSPNDAVFYQRSQRLVKLLARPGTV